MSRNLFSITLVLALALPGISFSAKPVRETAPSVPAPLVHSVKIDYNVGQLLVYGENLDPMTASISLGGVALSLDVSSTADTLLLPVTEALAAAVNSMGNYVLVLSNDGGTLSLSTFIPIALSLPGPPLPPGPECPCSNDWEYASNTASPNGFAGQTPYCDQDTGSFVTVQYYDVTASNYWVLWTEWNGSSGYCELVIDGPSRDLTTENQFNACADYLRNIVTVYGSQNMTCVF